MQKGSRFGNLGFSGLIAIVEYIKKEGQNKYLLFVKMFLRIVIMPCLDAFTIMIITNGSLYKLVIINRKHLKLNYLLY